MSYIKPLKEVMSPHTIGSTYCDNFDTHLKYCSIFWGGDTEGKGIFKLQERVMQNIRGVGKRTSCRQIFRDLNILAVAYVNITEIVSYIKRNKENLEQAVNVHYYNTQKKLYVHVQFRIISFYKTWE
jgi:hypothetical protein